jgi:hypothetical protein
MEYYDPPEERDGPVVRWLKFASLIVFTPLILGTLLAVWIYLPMYLFDWHHPFFYPSIFGDTLPSMAARFEVGAVLGLILSVAYVVRCIARGDDP